MDVGGKKIDAEPDRLHGTVRQDRRPRRLAHRFKYSGGQVGETASKVTVVNVDGVADGHYRLTSILGTCYSNSRVEVSAGREAEAKGSAAPPGDGHVKLGEPSVDEDGGVGT